MTDSITIKDTFGKVIFWDIDGTLAPYRWDGGINDVSHYGEEICPAVEHGLFLNRQPSKHMQRIVKSCKAENQFVIGHYIYEKEKSDKIEWLHEYYPQIVKSIFVKLDQSKADALIEFCGNNNISLDRVLFVDDRVDILKEAENKGIECWHISSFMDWFEKPSKVEERKQVRTVDIKDGVAYYNPPLQVEDARKYFLKSLNTTFIFKNEDGIFTVIAYSTSLGYDEEFIKLFEDNYKGKGYGCFVPSKGKYYMTLSERVNACCIY